MLSERSISATFMANDMAPLPRKGGFPSKSSLMVPRQ